MKQEFEERGMVMRFTFFLNRILTDARTEHHNALPKNNFIILVIQMLASHGLAGGTL